jgi:hypothetical protein
MNLKKTGVPTGDVHSSVSSEPSVMCVNFKANSVYFYFDYFMYTESNLTRMLSISHGKIFKMWKC